MVDVCGGWWVKDWFPFCLLTEIHGKGSNGDNVFWSATVYSCRGRSLVARATPTPRSDDYKGQWKHRRPHRTRRFIILLHCTKYTDCRERHCEGWTSTSGVIAAVRRSRSGKMAGKQPSVERYLYNWILGTRCFATFVIVPTRYTKRT